MKTTLQLAIGLMACLFVACQPAPEEASTALAPAPEPVSIELVEDEAEHNSDTVQSNPEYAINIAAFSDFPPEVDGCACYFSASENEFNEHQYIYVDDYGQKAFMHIEGSMMMFQLDTSNVLSETHTIDQWSNENYTLEVDMQQVGQIDETWQKSVTLTLTHKGGEVVVLTAYGECGC